MRKLLTILAVFTLPLPGFAQENPLFKYIPEKSGTVVHVDLFRLGMKFPLAKFKSSFIYKEISKSPGASIFSILGEPGKSGIDLSRGLMIIVEDAKPGQDRYGIPGISLFVKLNNAEAFTQRIKELNKENDPVKVYGTDRVIISESRMAIGWNNDVVVLTSKYDHSIQNEMFDVVTDPATVEPQFDTVATATTDNDYKAHAFDYKLMMEKIKRSQRNMIFDLLAPEMDNSICRDPQFIELMNEKADARIWSMQDGGKIPLEFLGIAPFLKNLQSISGKKGTATFNFENGKIVVRGNNYPGPEMSELYKLQAARRHDNSLIARAPVDGRFGLFSISFDQDFARGVKKHLALDELLASKKDDDKFDFSLLNGAIKSQAMLVLMKNIPDPSKQAEDNQAGIKHWGPAPLVAVEIADLQKFEALKEALLTLDKKKREEGQEEDEFKLVIKNNDKIAVLTVSNELADRFMAPPDPSLPSWVTEFQDYPFLGNIDFVSLFNVFTKSLDEEKNNPANEIFRKALDQVYFYGGKYEDGVVKNNFEFRFADKDKNSLVQLVDLVNNLAEQMKGDEESRSEIFKNGNIKIQEVTLTDVEEEKRITVPPPAPPKPKKKN